MSEIRVSIIVPAFREGENIKLLTEGIFKALSAKNLDKVTELIIVDDNSKDKTVEVVQQLKSKYPVRVIVRTTERGLSSAVLRGFSEAKGRYLLCMDADLQHPPQSVPDLIESLEKGNEFVIGTRYGGGSLSVDKDWPMHRIIISKGARALARPLTPLSDPMTGFFGITRPAYQRAIQNGINPIGFKIALEMYVKARIKKHGEVSIVFGVRHAGESKLTGAVIINYLKHLVELYSFALPLLLPILLAVALVLLYVLYKILV
ncbi:dolichol-phosphate mannosyltransferase [Acrasis kona]|uniref:Dolichol-phosphate mannosyltransferase subunit 1 n=1 Tax=Acrasis kona TaxID=1008807 RepID=A0AAW2ZPT0_9EUKA